MSGSPVYLTFDDGPNEGTPDVLEVLRAENVKATFFLTAITLERTPGQQYSLIQDMLKDGHALGNHGYDHDPMTRKGYNSTTPSEVKKDFDNNLDKLYTLFDVRNGIVCAVFPGFKIARLPGDGRFMLTYVEMIVRDLKIPHAGWDFEFADNGRMGHITYRNWQGVAGVAGTKSGFPGAHDILLLHDRHWKDKKESLANLLRKLKERLSFATLVPVPPGLRSIKYPP